MVPRIALLPFAALITWTSSASAQESSEDLIEQVRRREKIAAQAVEQRVRDMIARADRLGDDRTQAEKLLRDALDEIKNDRHLSLSTHATLNRIIRQRLKQLAEPATAEEPEPQAILRREETLREAKRTEAEIAKALDDIRTLRQEGRAGDAQRVADEISARYPDNGFLGHVRRNLSIAQQVHEATKLADQKGSRTALALRDVDRSALPIVGDIEYPKNFLEMSKKRKARYGGGVKRTKKEAEILRSLGETVGTTIEFNNENFDNVIKALQDLVGQPLMVNRAAIEELKIDYDVPISSTIPRGVTKRTALQHVLGNLGLTFIIKNEAIEVTSVMRAQSEMVTRYYQIDDLLGPGSINFGHPPRNPLQPNNPVAPFRGNSLQQQAERIIDMITMSVDPDSWERNGGEGSIMFFEPSWTLIVRNSAEVHNMLGGGLK